MFALFFKSRVKYINYVHSLCPLYSKIERNLPLFVCSSKQRTAKLTGSGYLVSLLEAVDAGLATMESTNRYISPINPAVFPHLATVLLAIGTFFTAWFFVFEVSRPRNNKESTIFKELLISLFASIFLGFGILFLALSVGIYV